ncbi:hypothetical protein JCM11251_000101 [Rhodosporidiobolus azoricus]
MPALEQRYDQSSAPDDSEDFVNANTGPPTTSQGRAPSSASRPSSSAAVGQPSSRSSHISGGSRHSQRSKVHSSSSSESELSDSEEERQLQEELDDAGGVEEAGAVRGAPAKKAWIMQSVSKGRTQSRAQQEYAALDDAEAGGAGTLSSHARQHSRRSSRSSGMAGEQDSGQVHRSKHHKYKTGGEKRSSRSSRRGAAGAGTQYAIGKADPEKAPGKSAKPVSAPASKSKKKIWLCVIGAIILIIVFAGVVFVIIDQTKKSDNEEASSTAESAVASNGTASATGSNSLATAHEPSSYGDTATFKSGTEPPGSPTTSYNDGQYHPSSAVTTARPTGLTSLGATETGEEGDAGLLTLGVQSQSGMQSSQMASSTGHGIASASDATISPSSHFTTGSSTHQEQQQQQPPGQQTGWNGASTASIGAFDGQQQQSKAINSNAPSAQPTGFSSDTAEPNAAATPTNSISGGVWGAPSILPAGTSAVPLGPGPQVASQPQNAQQGQQSGTSSQDQGGSGGIAGQAPTGASPTDSAAPSTTDAWGAPAATNSQQGPFNNGMWNGDTSVSQNPDDGQYHGGTAQGQQDQSQNGQSGNTASNNGQWSGASGWGGAQAVEETQSRYSNATAYQAMAPETYQVYQGIGTYFENSGHYGACGIATNQTDFVVALSDSMWLQSTNNDATQQSPSCNAEVLLTNKQNGMSVKAWVTERCASCVGDGSLDLSKPAFAAISGGGYDIGRLELIWGFTGDVAPSAASSTPGTSPLTGAASTNVLNPTAVASGVSAASSGKVVSSSTGSGEDDNSGWFKRILPTEAAQMKRRKRVL